MNNIKSKALEVARESLHKTKMGCILLKKNRIITTATNSYKTHPVQAKWAEKVGKKHCIHLHAEMNALIQSREEADTLVVARVLSSGNVGVSKPCKICRAYIEQTGIKKLLYINHNNEWVEERLY